MNSSRRILSNCNQSCKIAAVCAVLLLAAISLSAQSFTSLRTFRPDEGSFLNAPLVQGLDGNFYGVALQGGKSKACTGGCGTLFRVTSQGAISVVYTFIAGSEYPGERLQLASDGNFFTTTEEGGPYLKGSVVRITPQGRIVTLHAFSGPDGSDPTEGMVQGMDGNFYGSTADGGVSQAGTFFKINTKGQFTNYPLASTANGFWPMPLVQGADGNFYTTFLYGGENNHGAVIKLTPAGTVTVLHPFTTSNGQGSFGGVIAGPDGNFYGTTQTGGTTDTGTVYRITPNGVYTTLHSFTGPDGEAPAGMVLGTDGNFYGLTNTGGAHNCGTVYQITPQGSLTTLYNFCSQANCADGTGPGQIMQATDGDFYGTTLDVNSAGTFFKLSMGLAPFIKTVPISGAVGRQVKILGNDLTGAISVTFNGKPSAFTVISATAIATTVPAGATTGSVLVTTPTGTLKSNVVFRVP